MIGNMLENRAVRFVVYGTSAVLLSEIAYRGFRLLHNKLTGRNASDDGDASQAEISEVIWTNELTQACSAWHRKGFATKKCENNSGEYVVQLPSPTTDVPCRNRYCAGNNVGRAITLIDSSQYCIDLAMYTFTSHELSLAVGRAVKRGVDVRIISDKEMVYSSGSEIINLTKAGVPVRCPSSTMLMHHKFCIIDGPMRVDSVLKRMGIKKNVKKRVVPVLLSGSLNWTMQGFGGNWENIIITSNRAIVKQFECEYERMWKAFQI